MVLFLIWTPQPLHLISCYLPDVQYINQNNQPWLVCNRRTNRNIPVLVGWQKETLFLLFCPKVGDGNTTEFISVQHFFPFSICALGMVLRWVLQSQHPNWDVAPNKNAMTLSFFTNVWTKAWIYDQMTRRYCECNLTYYVRGREFQRF